MCINKIRKIVLVLLIFTGNTFAQTRTENVVLITIDGLRWQELFKGADPSIITNKRFINDGPKLKESYWDSDLKSRRQKLLPFFWGTIARQGQIYGNRDLGNKVNVANRYLFSYPGYNELLTGKADKRIRSNAKRENPNRTILEFANQQKDFKDKVAAFASWGVFHYIINPKRSGIHVNAGNDTARFRLTAREKYLNHLQRNTPSPWKATRFDEFTHNYAKEYLKKNSPRLVLIAYGETDEFAHQGRYEDYLQAAYNTDRYIGDVWDWIQSDKRYKDKTTLIITTDHGRGSGRRSWRNHGAARPGSNHTWFAILGPDTEPLGEMKMKGTSYTNQLTNTIAAFLNLKYPQNNEAIAAMTGGFR
jgi:arylsulfatase A-like enzyme